MSSDLVSAVSTLEMADLVTATQLRLPRDLPFEQYVRLGRNIRMLRDASKWWLGDWIIFGEDTYDEKYSQAVEVTDYSLGYLRNIVYTCRNVAPSRRRDDLSFSHHMEVAKLNARDQRRWLGRAVREELSEAVLRELIREEQSLLPNAGDNGATQRSPDRQAGGSAPKTPQSQAKRTGLPLSYLVPGATLRRLVQDAIPGRNGYVKVPRDLIERLRNLIEEE